MSAKSLPAIAECWDEIGGDNGKTVLPSETLRASIGNHKVTLFFPDGSTERWGLSIYLKDNPRRVIGKTLSRCRGAGYWSYITLKQLETSS